MDVIITNQDIADLRRSYGEERSKIIHKIRQRGFENTLKDLHLPSDLQSEWRNLHTGAKSLLEYLLEQSIYKSADEKVPFILEHWEPNIGINPIKEAAEKMTKEEVYQRVVNRFSCYKDWKAHGHTFDFIYRNIRTGLKGGSFVHGGFMSVGGYVNGKSIGSDKILVSWASGKHFIFTVRQVLEDVLGETKNRQLSLF